MFSSPARGGSSRRRHVDGLTGSARSSRASTPATGRAATPTASRRRDSVRLAKPESLAPPSTLGDESMSESVRTERRKDKSRSGLEEGTVLSRDDYHSVSTFSRMPAEVTAALQNASPYDPIQSALDPVTGFAYAITRDTCFVWNFVPRGYEAPTCFAYSLPATSSSSTPEALVQCALVPKGPDREPGILFLFASGSVRYSDYISNALASDRQQDTSVALGMGESVVLLHRCHSHLYVAATTHSRLISIQLIASGGHLRPLVSLFAQPRGIFGRLFGVAANLATSNAGTIGLTSSISADGTGAYDVYALSQQTLQKWCLADGRGERLLFEEDIRTGLITRDERIAEGSHSAESLKVVDVATTNKGSLVLLYSFELADGGVLHYGLALVEAQGVEPCITSQFDVSYSRMTDSRPYSRPRLVLPVGGPVIFIVFTEAVVFRLTDRNGLEESIELRDVASNRILGTGSESQGSAVSDNISRLTLITQRSGALLVEVDIRASSQLSELISSGEDRNVVDTHRLKTKLERGVFHSDNVHNPISFDLPVDTRGDLMAAAEQLSDDIVRSESPSLATTLSVKAQLANRLERLHSLAAFLSLNGMLGLLSQNCLRRLCADAQLVAAAIDLWEYANELLSTPARVHKSGNILLTAVQEIVQESDGSDQLRHFFRYELRELNAVLFRVRDLAEQSAVEGIIRQSYVTCEANRTILTTYQAAWRYRIETADLYRLDPSQIAFESWLCTSDNVYLLRESSKSTAALIQERTRQLGTSIDHEPRELFMDAISEEDVERQMQVILKGQLCELVAHTLDVYEERLAYLRQAGSSHPSLEREHSTLQAEHATERRNLLVPLVSIGRSDRAFHLAEEHHDFETLTELCSTLPAQQRGQRIGAYLNKYEEPFAVALYTFFVQTGQMHTLLAQDESFYGLLKRFLDGNPLLNRVAWLHDFVLDDYRNASRRLLYEAGQEKQSTSSKRLMLSLAKLCHVSQLSEMQVATQSEQAAIEVVDDQLDLVNVHDRIRQALLAGIDVDQVDDAGMAAAEQASLVLAQSKPATAELYAAVAKRLFEERVLLSEDLIDLLTLHDATDNSLQDFALAIEVFVRARDMPPGRAQTTLAALWRRVILYDDWQAVTQTNDTADAVLAARLRSTALYNTLLSAAGNESTAEVVLAPTQTLVLPPFESLQARFDTESDESLSHIPIDGLMQEAQGELDAVQALLAESDLQQWFQEVQRLVEETLGDQTLGPAAALTASSSSGGSQAMIM